ncbi:threonine/serine exporter family protein [Metabacillus sediminilitoris]|uniref:Threonine/serine exporter family protein n=1 Tax=Metabacillus sediminilitoris TaxID=2567941 RepID=A0A4S4BN89_9BACI|nr:threonine/serine exporter family protein [Metabacillus sediminilitoris]QGQ48435.1 threonine/serine exporter [Metabacillus sediminilitoris]THF76331.1 threonine/serine exporter family protein [Metabacillus sediminilitoris]
MDKKQDQTFDIIEVCLLAGKIMLRGGAETYRVEDTMMRIAAAYGIYHSHSYVTPTGIIFSIDSHHPTKLVRIVDRSTNLQKVAKVNSVSRLISSGDLTVKEALEQLKEIERDALAYPTWVQIAAASISSGCFLIMFQGDWTDFLPALLTGGIGFSCLIYFHQLVEIKFFAEFLASLIIGLISVLFVVFNIGTELDKIIIGSVMPLVPGLLITNAVRDLMAGHLVSGISKGAEAFLTAFAIGAGVAIVFSF